LDTINVHFTFRVSLSCVKVGCVTFFRGCNEAAPLRLRFYLLLRFPMYVPYAGREPTNGLIHHYGGVDDYPQTFTVEGALYAKFKRDSIRDPHKDGR